MNSVIRTAVRTWFFLTPRRRASRAFRQSARRYLAIADSLSEAAARRAVRVPALPGVDPEMRDWSLFMLLEHNGIVNRSIAEIVGSLAADREPTGGGVRDPGKDVLPHPDAGPEQVASFRESVDAYLATVDSIGTLRHTRCKEHPVFGPLDAHGWHCMAAFHLRLHLRQADAIATALAAETESR